MMRRGQIMETCGNNVPGRGNVSACKDTNAGTSLVCSRERKKPRVADYSESQGEQCEKHH